MFLASKTLWRAGPLSKPLTSIVHVRQSGKRLYQQYQQQSRDNSTTRRGRRGRRIHIAGANRLQTIIANGLAQSANPKKNPITLMVPTNNYLQHYVDTNGVLQIIQNGVATTMVGAVDIEVLPFSMDSSFPEQTYPPAKLLGFQRLLLNTGPDEDDFSVDDLPSLVETGSIPDAKKKEGKKPSKMPISEIKVYYLSYFLQLNTLLCDSRKMEIDVVQERVGEIRAAPKESDIEAVPVTYLAKTNTEPIDNLIYAERSGCLMEFFKNIKHRLHSSSTVMVIGNNPGLVQTLCDMVFPDVSKRPNFVDCASGMYMSETAMEGFWDSPRSVSLVRAQLSVGPLARTNDDSQTPGQVEKREEEIKYLVGRVLNTPSLGAVTRSRAILERYKLKKLLARCVIYPLCVAFNCMMGEIFSTEERVTEAILLFEEACAVVQSIDPTLTRHILLQNLLWAVVRAPDVRPYMLQCVDLGYATNIDLDNGWIIKYGRGMTPTHEKYAKIVKERASDSARAIAANKEESAKAAARLRVAKEIAARKLEIKEQRLEYLDLMDATRKGFKRFVPGANVEAPLNHPAKKYFQTRSSTDASSIWDKLEAPSNNKMKEVDKKDPSAYVNRSDGDDAEKASDLGVDEKESGGGQEKTQT
ncbi:2-dehydropantoate 2-reductase (Ketopantoate reductase) (KPA reductase) (KPR) [Ciborinia camelliae]|nr:2-dehydropantoate 2-reductase (Ketopantoate reductase) (KPA reductase) (KPR) [Ciborinia camelliae]